MMPPFTARPSAATAIMSFAPPVRDGAAAPRSRRRIHAERRHQRQRVDERRQHAGAMIPVGLDLVGRLGLQVEAEPGEQQRQRVGEVVAGIGEQRQRVGVDPREQFHRHERQVAASDQRKMPPVPA